MERNISWEVIITQSRTSPPGFMMSFLRVHSKEKRPQPIVSSEILSPFWNPKFSSCPGLGLSSCLFPSGIATKILLHFLSPHPCYMPLQIYSPLIYQPTNILWSIHVTKLLIMHSYQLPTIYNLLGRNFVPTILISNTPTRALPIVWETSVLGMKCENYSEENSSKHSPNSVSSKFLPECSYKFLFLLSLLEI
jgi:hypothetical protein